MSELQDLDLGMLNAPGTLPANPEFSLSQTPSTQPQPIRPAPSEQTASRVAAVPVLAVEPLQQVVQTQVVTPVADILPPAIPVQKNLETVGATLESFAPGARVGAQSPQSTPDFSLPKPAPMPSFVPVQEAPISLDTGVSMAPTSVAVQNLGGLPLGQASLPSYASQDKMPKYSNNTRAVWHIQKHQNFGFYFLILLALGMIGGGFYLLVQSGSLLEALDTPALKNILQSE